MALDWEEFLRSHRVHYVTRGPNTPRNHVSVKCPWCGPSDPSEHMAISLDGHGWHCWRNRDHKGRSPLRLIQALIGCTYEQARLISGLTTSVPEDFLSTVQAQFVKPEDTPNAFEAPVMPPEFKKLNNLPSCRPYLRYLERRGFVNYEFITNKFDVRYCNTGPFHGRIIFPVYYKGQLRNWTARAISSREMLRYKQPTTQEDKAEREGIPLIKKPVGHFLPWFDLLMDEPDDTICLTEGPFDALKVNYLGWKFGIRATCFFTNSPSDPQIDFLHELLPKYKRRLLILDQGTTVIALRTLDRLTGFDLKVVQLPEKFKDPGEIPTSAELLKLCT